MDPAAYLALGGIWLFDALALFILFSRYPRLPRFAVHFPGGGPVST
jgi:hypothetical protein